MSLKMTLLRCFALNVLLLTHSVHAWTWKWFDEGEGEMQTATGDSRQSCTKFELLEGNTYFWDPEDSKYCINMFIDDHCETRNGYSCLIWGPRDSGQPIIKSYMIHKRGDDIPWDGVTSVAPTASSSSSSSSRSSSSSAVSSSFTSTVRSTSSQSTLTTAISTPTQPAILSTNADNTDTNTPISTPTPTPTPDSDGATLSGGAIGGTVVGAVAGVGVLALFGVLVYRRRNARGKPEVKEITEDTFRPPPPPKDRSQELDSTPTSPADGPPQPSQPSQPPPMPSIQQIQQTQTYPPEKIGAVRYGSNRPPMAELPSNFPIYEMDAAR